MVVSGKKHEDTQSSKRQQKTLGGKPGASCLANNRGNVDNIRTDAECQKIANRTDVPFVFWRKWFEVPAAPLAFRVAMQKASLKSMTRRVGNCSEGRWFIYPSYRAKTNPSPAQSHTKMEKERDYKIKMWAGSSLIKSERVPSVGEERAQRGGGARGKVKGYTPASRQRLQKRLAMIKNKHLSNALFVTLTYPAKHPPVDIAKGHLRAFIKRIRYKFPNAAIGWRLEFQKRGAVHFHLLVLGVRFLPNEVVAGWWYKIVGSGDEKHLRAGTEVRRVKSARHAAYYISKYMAKAGEQTDIIPEGTKPGRFWGFEGRVDLYVGEIIEIMVSGYGHLRVARFMRSLIASQYRKNGKKHRDRPPAIGCSRTWFGDIDAIMRAVASVGLSA